MRRSTFLFSTSLLALGFGLVAQAATPTKMIDFHVSSVVPPNASLQPYCAMANQFDNGLIVTHSRNDFGLGSMSFDFPDIEFDQGKNYQITVKSGDVLRQYAAIATQSNLLIAKTGADEALFKNIDNGNDVSIMLDGTDVAYALNSNKNSFSDFNDCIDGLEQTPPMVAEKRIIGKEIPQIEPVIQKQNLVEKPTSVFDNLIDETATIAQPAKRASLIQPPSFDIPSSDNKKVPLSKPVNPAQLTLEKTTRRHSIKSSALLFDDIETARLAASNIVGSDELIKPIARSEGSNLIIDNIVNEAEVKKEETTELLPAVTQKNETIVEEPIIKSATPESIEAPIIPEIKLPEEIIEPVLPKEYNNEPVLPTQSLVQAPAPQERISKPIIQQKPDIIEPVKDSIPAIAPPKIATKTEVTQQKKPVLPPIEEKIELVEPVPVLTEPVMAPVLKPEPIIRQTVSTPKTFVPPASKVLQDWTVKNVPKTDGLSGYCLISNRFENGMGLYATRAKDGNSTVGLDFGFDILEQNQQYAVTVEVDHNFNKQFIGQANDEVMMIIQMGQQDQFFNAIKNGQALHISMPGAASTFDLKNISSAYSNFTQCLGQQNAKAIMPTMATAIEKNIPPITGIVQPTTKTEKSVLPTTSLPIFDNQKVTKSIKTKEYAPVINPVALDTFAQQFTPDTGLMNDNLSVDSILTASNINYSGLRFDDQDESIIHWTTGNQNVSGILVETPWASQSSLLDRLMDDVDTMEQTCMGEFTSQIGIPEKYGSNVIAHLETKCITNGLGQSAAHIYQGIGNKIKVWTQSGPSTLSSEIIGSRNKISGILRQRAKASQ